LRRSKFSNKKPYMWEEVHIYNIFITKKMDRQAERQTEQMGGQTDRQTGRLIEKVLNR